MTTHLSQRGSLAAAGRPHQGTGTIAHEGLTVDKARVFSYTITRLGSDQGVVACLGAAWRRCSDFPVSGPGEPVSAQTRLRPTEGGGEDPPEAESFAKSSAEDAKRREMPPPASTNCSGCRNGCSHLFKGVARKLKILLIIPPYPVEEYPALATGPMYLAAVLMREGHDVEVLDLLVSEPTRHKVEETLGRCSPDLVGITCVTMTFPRAAEILGWVKESRPEVKTVVGGPHVSFAAERSLQECPAADIVVRGEGEETVAELAQVLSEDGDLSQVRGLSFRRDGAIHATQDRPLVAELDALPFPAWDKLPLARYRALRGKVGVLSSRGCPYGCIFCVGQRMVGRKGRFRSPDSVVDEMEWLASRGFSSIGIDDDLFTLRQGHVEAVCGEIRSRHLPITFHAFARVDTVDPQLLKTMKDAGCADILYGVESGCQEILDRIGKRISLEQVRRAVAMGKEAGISIFASFILGLPGETPETLRRTAEFARSLGCKYGFHLLSPFPGTRIRDEAQAFGISILTDRWDHYDANRVVTLTPHVIPEDIQEVLDRYDRDVATYCALQEEHVRLGIAPEQERHEVLTRRLKALAWEILRHDLLEKHGLVRGEMPREEALVALGRQLSQHLPFPLHRVQEGVEIWDEEGLLRCDRTNEGSRWRWASNEEIRVNTRPSD